MLLRVLDSCSQEFSTHWVSHPLPNDSSEVLFCGTYEIDSLPKEAYLTFASSGHLRIYVNERNISQDITFNNPDSSHIALQTYNITHLLKTKQNCIAVWYAPAKGCATSKQLSLDFYGTHKDGKRFYCQANADWWCKILEGSYVKDNRETFDSRYYDANWKSAEDDKTSWQHPLGAKNNEKFYSVASGFFCHKNARIQYIFTPTECSSAAKLLEYDLGRRAYGTLRLTLRGEKSGDAVHIGSFTYICRGDMDEQAFCRFIPSGDRIINVQGTPSFKRQFIQKVEFLEYRSVTPQNL